MKRTPPIEVPMSSAPLLTARRSIRVASAAALVAATAEMALISRLLRLDQLYPDPYETGKGLRSAALRQVQAEAQAAGLPIGLMALKESRANGFCRRHGFRFVEALEWDNVYQWP